jgi:hypothetical protein
MAFTLNEIQYPNNWLKLSSAEDRAEREIEGPLPEPAWYDQRWCWGYDEEGKLIWKDHAPLVTEYIGHVHANANAILRETDWQVIREVDNLTPVSNDIKTSRQNIRILCGNKVTNIGITTTTGELATYVTSPQYSSWTAPYASWTLNQETAEWEAPVPYPTDGESYTWNEEEGKWTLVITEE